MKWIHTGDIHVGSAFSNLPREKADLRKRELIDGFRRLATFAKENGVQAVLIAGDLFDENQVSFAVKREIFAIMQQAQPVAFFYVLGNHDEGVAILEDLPNNVHVFSDARGWKQYELSDGVVVTGMDGKYIDEDAYGRLSLNKSAYNVVLLHGETVAKTGERGQIVLSKLQNKHVDYLALGHIHKPMLTAETLDGRGCWRYCGCLEGRGFDECGARGFFLLEVENGKLLGEKFYSFAKRTLHETRVDISACREYYDVEQTCLKQMQAFGKESMVKVVLFGRHVPELRKDVSFLERRLQEEYFFVRIEDETQMVVEKVQDANAPTLRNAFINEVGRVALNDDLRKEVLEIGLKALLGEEIDV